MKVCNKKPVTRKRAGTKRAARTKRTTSKSYRARRRRRAGCGIRCQHPGPIVRNPYLNFLRTFRKQNCGLSPVETIRRGARAWKSLNVKEKLHFIKEAFYAPKRHWHHRNMKCQLVCKKRPPCPGGQIQRKRTRRKRTIGKRRGRKPKASGSKPGRRRGRPPKAGSSKDKSSSSKTSRRRSSKMGAKKAGFTC